MTEVITHVSRGFSCNTYLCRDTESGRFVLVDPGAQADEVLELLQGARPEKILLTHGHFDHIAAAREVRRATGAPICVHRLEAELLSDPLKNASAQFCRATVSFEADLLLEEGDVIRFGESELRVILTPGHSPGGVCYVSDSFLFSGDTLFSDGVGRCDLYGGNAAALAASLKRLAALPFSPFVCPGHGEGFSLSRRIAQMRLP